MITAYLGYWQCVHCKEIAHDKDPASGRKCFLCLMARLAREVQESQNYALIKAMLNARN